VGQYRGSHPNITAYLALLIGVFCIGFSAIFVKFADLPGPVSAFYRVLIAAAVMLPWRIAQRNALPKTDLLRLIALGGIFFALDLWLWNTSILLTTAAKATLLANNAPLWIGLGSLIIFREKLPVGFYLGLMIAMVGMAIIVGVDAWRAFHFNAGDLLAISASLFYAAYLLTTQKARTFVDTLTFNSVYMTAAALILLPINVLGGYSLIGFSTQSWLALLGLGLISQLGGWLAINYALGHLRAAHVSVSLLGQAVVTALLGIPLLGEGLTWNQVIGGVLVLSGIYLVNLRNAGKKI
jgi:drug/metabolite transporter (DMT)-like permease